MKIGILTHYNVINNGATLQMLALKKYLEERGNEVFILTYQKNYDFSKEASTKYSTSLASLFFIFKKYFVKGSPGLFTFKAKKQFVFKKYIKNNFSFLPFDSKMDAVIIGSDEVFSLEVGCNKMMYGHGLNTKKIISYAPSFGQTDIKRIQQYNCEDVISSGLKLFTAISARDEFTAKTIRLVSGIDPVIVCDPVILYDFSKIHVTIKKPKHKYILLYSYDKNMNKNNEIYAIKKYAKEKGCSIYSVGTYHSWCDKNILCNPLEWIEYFKNAEEIITDTFHGSVLSIICQKKASFFVRSINSNKMAALISSFGLEDFILKDVSYEELKRVDSEILNKEKLLQNIKSVRTNGKNFLEKALSNGRD